MAMLSKTQIDNLGDRLREDSERSEEDLNFLQQFRNSFDPALDYVLNTLKALGQEPVPRLKTEVSIIEKLRRRETTLSKMQDIVGCRIVVENIVVQNNIVALLEKEFASLRIVDRRIKPRNGYRAVHVICKAEGFHVEIQVRTQLQHRWAELSENIAGGVGIEIKYGKGDAEWLKLLSEISWEICICEIFEHIVIKSKDEDFYVESTFDEEELEIFRRFDVESHKPMNLKALEELVDIRKKNIYEFLARASQILNETQETKQ